MFKLEVETKNDFFVTGTPKHQLPTLKIFQLVVFQNCIPFCYACGSGTCPFRGDWVSVPTPRRAYSTSVQLASLSLGIGHWANDRNGKCTHTASVREDHFEWDSGELPGVSCHQATLPSHFRLPVAPWLCRLGSKRAPRQHWQL